MKWDNDENENRTSKFNTAGLAGSTLENLWKDTYSAMAMGNYLYLSQQILLLLLSFPQKTLVI